MREGLALMLQIFGGLAMFLVGMEGMSAALQRTAGVRMKQLLQAAAGGPLRAVLTGALVTAVLQSSSAVTVLVLGFVSAGLLELPQAIAVIFGANIGTTMTAQLLAFRLEDWVGLILFAGFFLQFAARGRVRTAGSGVFCFGLLFEGIAVMGGALQPLTDHPAVQLWLQQVKDRPVLGILLGCGMTLTVQSSSATIAVLQKVASQPGPDGVHSLLGLAGALPVLLGDNIGTTITAVLASIGQSRDAKRVAAAHCCFNLSGAVVFCIALPWFEQAVRLVSPQGAELDIIARQIANAHTLFNTVCTLLWLPLLPVMVRLVTALVPEKKSCKSDQMQENGFVQNTEKV